MLYYPIVLIFTFFYYHWNKLVDKISGFDFGKEENQNTFIPFPKEEKPKIVNTFIGMYFHTYANKLLINMLSIIPDNWFTRITKKYALKMTPNKNYVLMMLLGKVLSPNEIDDLLIYKPMAGGRWSGQLNKWYNDRKTLQILDNAFPGSGYTESNCLDRDYALKLLEKQVKN